MIKWVKPLIMEKQLLWQRIYLNQRGMKIQSLLNVTCLTDAASEVKDFLLIHSKTPEAPNFLSTEKS